MGLVVSWGTGAQSCFSRSYWSLQHFFQDIIQAYKDGTQLVGSTTSMGRWEFVGSFFFSVSTITTIGKDSTGTSWCGLGGSLTLRGQRWHSRGCHPYKESSHNCKHNPTLLQTASHASGPMDLASAFCQTPGELYAYSSLGTAALEDVGHPTQSYRPSQALSHYHCPPDTFPLQSQTEVEPACLEST